MKAKMVRCSGAHWTCGVCGCRRPHVPGPQCAVRCRGQRCVPFRVGQRKSVKQLRLVAHVANAYKDYDSQGRPKRGRGA
jgi:hypothetical protein